MLGLAIITYVCVEISLFQTSTENTSRFLMYSKLPYGVESTGPLYIQELTYSYIRIYKIIITSSNVYIPQ